MERRHHAQEHLLGIHDRPGMEDVILDRGADILWQRQDRGASRFAADPNDRIVPVDIVQPKIGDIAGTQGEPGEEQQDGAIAQSHDVVRRRPPGGRLWQRTASEPSAIPPASSDGCHGVALGIQRGTFAL